MDCPVYGNCCLTTKQDTTGAQQPTPNFDLRGMSRESPIRRPGECPTTLVLTGFSRLNVSRHFPSHPTLSSDGRAMECRQYEGPECVVERATTQVSAPATRAILRSSVASLRSQPAAESQKGLGDDGAGREEPTRSPHLQPRSLHSSCKRWDRTHMLSTPAGDVNRRIPKLQAGSFFPSRMSIPTRHPLDPASDGKFE